MRTPRLIAILTILWLGGCGGSGGEDAPKGPPAEARSPAANGGSGENGAAAPAGATAIPNGPWTDLARRLVRAENLKTAVDVTREVLSRGGVATVDGERAIVGAVAPAASFQAIPIETVHLAMEARRRPTAARLTAADLAQMLEGFGWPFPGGRKGGGDADSLPRGRSADPEALREAERKERAAREAEERAGADAMESAIDAERQAGRERIEAAQQAVREATDAWQRARLPAVRAPAGEKAAAEAALKEKAAARQAAIEQLGVLRKNESDAERERRQRASQARESGWRIKQVRDRIGPDYAAGERIMEMLAAWVRAAAQDPDNPRSFTPLFLAEMARLQDPPVDLLGSRYTRPGRGDGAPVDLRGGPRSAQLRLTLLEIELIAAAFHRPPPSSASMRDDSGRTLMDTGDRYGVRGLAKRDVVAPAGFVPAFQDPCSDLKKTFGDLGGEAAGVAASELAGSALGGAVEAATDAGTADAFGNAMSAVGIAAKIAKLVAFYSDSQVTVKAEPPGIHKPTGDNLLAAYTATAGVSDEDWQEYERLAGGASKIDRAARDCLGVLGMPTLTNVSDLAKEAESWLVEWRLVEGAPPHAYYSLRNNDFYLPGRGAMKLQRSGANSASAVFVVDILPEAKHTGTVVRAYVTARASVDAAGMPSLGTLLNPVKGILGLVDALVELGAGWFQYMNMPKAYGTIEVEYHCPRPTTLHRPTGPVVADGGGDDGPDDCLIAAGGGK